MNDYVRLSIGESAAQTNLDAPLKVQNTRNVVGSFYEALAAHLFSAVRWQGREVYPNEGDRDADAEGPDPPCVIPDLVQRERSTFIEVKGGNPRSQYKLFRWQAELYDEIRRRGTQPMYRPRVEYAIFMHNLLRMTKRQKTARKLIAALAQNTECCVLMDLDVVLRFERWCGTAEYLDPEARTGYPTFYTFSPKYLKLLLADPRSVLRELELEDCTIDGQHIKRQFSIHRFTASVGDRGPLFPSLSVGDTPIQPFPVLTIRRKRKLRPPYTGPVDMSWRGVAQQEYLIQPPADPLEALANGGGDDEDIPF